MKRTLIFLWILLFFNPALNAQLSIPGNTLIDSELERQMLNDVSNGMDVDPFLLQLSVNFTADESLEIYTDIFTNYVADLANKRHKGLTDEDFLSTLYYKTHKKFLKNYQAYSSFGEVLDQGAYDCLSATVLYALLLDAFNFSYEIVETDYHIYLMVYSDNNRYMLESTDPINGFVTDEKVIKTRIEEIEQRNNTLSEGYLTLQTDNRRFNDLFTLAGLQYFNAAVYALRDGEVIASVDQLEKARLYDDADRFKAFGKHLAKVLVHDSELDPELKQRYLLKLTRVLNKGMITASL